MNNTPARSPATTTGASISLDRRDFLKTGALLGTALLVPPALNNAPAAQPSRSDGILAVAAPPAQPMPTKH
ncbi:MAG: twin-arginine translocation signal domain-containing protein, partial [Opitutaceae bacterium]|nr:twin-arginine translocation signal domain-containing protein [Opitutaceae bacterium]